MRPEDNGSDGGINLPDANSRDGIQDSSTPAGPPQQSTSGSLAPNQTTSSSVSEDVSEAQPLNEPVVAEDSDLIEQQWVYKAKAIVDSTRDDPHAQNKEINKVKAEYIKKRYNREIKTDDEQL